MTIQDLGSLGELVSAVAVVVTLAYLATQIRYARLAAADAARQYRAESVREMQLAMINNPAYREAWTAADPLARPRYAEIAALLHTTPDQAELVWHGCCAWAWIHWGQFRSMKTPEDERELENLVAGFYSIPPLSVIWESDEFIRTLLEPEFVAWVDAVVARARQSASS